MPKGKGYSKTTKKDIRGFKKEIKSWRIPKDKRKKNATFEGPNKNSGVDRRKAINREKRSI